MLSFIFAIALPLAGMAQTDSCTLLRAILSSEEPRIEEAAELKAKCEYDLKNGANARLIELLNRLNLSEELNSAHTKRIEGSIKRYTDFKDSIAAFKTELEGLKGKKERRNAAVSFYRSLPTLNNKVQAFNSKASDRLETYYAYYFAGQLKEIRDITAASSNKDHKNLQVQLDGEIAKYKAGSDAQFGKLNNLMLKEMRKTMSFLEFKKTDVLARADDAAMESFAKDLAPILDKIEARSFWETYASKSKYAQRIEATEKKVALAMIQTAIDEYENLKQEINTVLSMLSPSFKKSLLSVAVASELARIDQRIGKLKSYSVPNAILLLKSSMTLSVKDLEQRKAICFAKLPALAPMYSEFKDKYNQFNSGDLGTLDEKSQRVVLLLAEGTQAQFNLIRSACMKGKL